MITITQKKNCSGCYACSNICPVKCINMIVDEEGFWYPKVNEKECIECNLCNNICPVAIVDTINNKPKAFACMNPDNDTRMSSSSGGVFSMIAERIINCGGVVFGAEFDEDFNVVHNYTETFDGLVRFRGSKYVQSKIGNTYSQAREFLEQGRQVLFSGTPCQISGLVAFLGKQYENLICVDIICHGVPSPLVWQKYLNYREQYCGSKAKSISFRIKDTSWKQYSVLISFRNNIEYRKNVNNDLYMQGFLKNLFLRPSCYDCRFKTIHRQSDITLADFWGIENIIPEFDDDKGTSLVFINSNAGNKTFDEIKNNMLYREVDVNKAITYNSSAIKSVDINPKRENFFCELNKYEIDVLLRKYCSDSHILKVRKILGRLRRKLKSKFDMSK